MIRNKRLVPPTWEEREKLVKEIEKLENKLDLINKKIFQSEQDCPPIEFEGDWITQLKYGLRLSEEKKFIEERIQQINDLISIKVDPDNPRY